MMIFVGPFGGLGVRSLPPFPSSSQITEYLGLLSWNTHYNWKKKFYPLPKLSKNCRLVKWMIFCCFFTLFLKSRSPQKRFRKTFDFVKKWPPEIINSSGEVRLSKVHIFVDFSIILKIFSKRFRGNTKFSKNIKFKAKTL